MKIRLRYKNNYFLTNNVQTNSSRGKTGKVVIYSINDFSGRQIIDIERMTQSLATTSDIFNRTDEKLSIVSLNEITAYVRYVKNNKKPA